MSKINDMGLIMKILRFSSVIIIGVLFCYTARSQMAFEIDLSAVSVEQKMAIALTTDLQKFYRDKSRGLSLGAGFVYSFGSSYYMKVVGKYIGTLIKDPQDTRSKSTAKRGLIFFSLGPEFYMKYGTTYAPIGFGFEGALEMRFNPKSKPRFIIPVKLGMDYHYNPLGTKRSKQLTYFFIATGVRILGKKKPGKRY